MKDVVSKVKEAMLRSNLQFSSKPVLIGGKAMEYYDMQGSWKPQRRIDLVVSQGDYQCLADRYPEKQKEILGDMGIVIGGFGIWKSIARMEYDFFRRKAVEEENILVISKDKLIFEGSTVTDLEAYRHHLDAMKCVYYRKVRGMQ